MERSQDAPVEPADGTEARPPLWERLDRRGKLFVGGGVVGVLALVVVAIALASGGSSGSASFATVRDLWQELNDSGFRCTEFDTGDSSADYELGSCMHEGEEVRLAIVHDESSRAEIAESVGDDVITGPNWLVGVPWGGSERVGSGWGPSEGSPAAEVMEAIGGSLRSGSLSTADMEQFSCTMEEYVENDGCP